MNIIIHKIMVQKVRTNSSNEQYDNRSDEQRVYDIEANVHIVGTRVNNMDSGNVYKDGAHVAQFNTWEENHLSVTYIGVDASVQNSINEAINVFINEVKESVSNN